MGYSKSPLAFSDIKEAFDRALDAPKGVRIRCATRSEAVVLRSRFHYFRKVDRATNRNIYEKDHPLYERSVYDVLVLRIPPKSHPNSHVLFIEPRSVEELNIEEIA